MRLPLPAIVLATVVAASASGCAAGHPTDPPTPLHDMTDLVEAWEQATGAPCAGDPAPRTHATESVHCNDGAVLSVFDDQAAVEAMVKDATESYEQLGGQSEWLVGPRWTINDSTLDYEAFSAQHGGEAVSLGAGR